MWHVHSTVSRHRQVGFGHLMRLRLVAFSCHLALFMQNKSRGQTRDKTRVGLILGCPLEIDRICPASGCLLRFLLSSLPSNRVQRGMYYYLDRRVGVHVEPLNCQEYLFKLALHRKQFGQVSSNGGV